MTFEFKHPKYYKELRSIRNKLDQAISNDTGIPTVKPRSPGPGLKLQASSSKPQAKPEPSSGSQKPQATSSRHRGPV